MITIKKIVLALLTLLALIFVISCGDIQDINTDIPSNGDTNTNADTATDGANSDTSTREDDTDTDTGNKETDSAESDTDSEADKESDNSSDTEVDEGEKITVSGNYTTDKSQVKTYNDRYKQIDLSNADYNRGSVKTPDEIKNIKDKAKIITYASLLYPNAAKAMKHYLSGTGEDLEIDLDDFFKDETALAYRNSDIEKALRAAEELAADDFVTVYTIEEQVHHGLSGDWKNTLGSYFVNIEIKNLISTNLFGIECYSATIKYTVVDFYNWDTNDYNSSVPVIELSPHDLHELHKAGEAKEFLSIGVVEYHLTWAKGADVETVLNGK